jgi:hypothetical protein
MKKRVDISPVADIQPDVTEEAMLTLCRSTAVQRARISTRGAYKVTDLATGESMYGEGPALVLVINEKMLRQGW